MKKEKNVVLVTGSSIGLGAVTVELFASKGYDVIINYLNHEKEAFELRDKIISDYNVKALCIKCDITNEEDVKIMVNEIKREFGGVSCLVNNAGISIDNDIVDKSVFEFKKVVDCNLVAPFVVSKWISTIMDTGSIINISSTDGIDTCYKEEMDYAASKAGLISLTKTMAKKFSPKIRVNAVAPGWINTDMNKDMYEEFKNDEIDKILLKRFADPIEVASVIYFLSTKESSYINGTVIRVDGGY